MNSPKDPDKMSERELRAEVKMLRAAANTAWGHTNQGVFTCRCCESANSVLGEALINANTEREEFM